MLADRPTIDLEAVVTFDRIDGFDVLANLGIVCGEAVVPRNLYRATFRTLGSIVGTGAANYLTDAERARKRALEALLERARTLGANGIVKLRFATAERADGSTHVSARGEALLLDPAPGASIGTPR